MIVTGIEDFMRENSIKREHMNVYVFGNTARRLDTMPDFNQHEGRRINREPIAVERPATKQKIDVFSVLLIMITFAAVMITGIIYLNLNFQSTYLSKSVVKLEREVAEMKKDNAVAAEQLEDGVNLKQIYKRATKELGMKPMKKSMIFTYTRKNSSEIRQYGEIPA